MISIKLNKDTIYHLPSERLDFISWELEDNIKLDLGSETIWSVGFTSFDVSGLKGFLGNEVLPIQIKVGAKSIISVYPPDIPDYVLDNKDLLDGIILEIEDELINSFKDLSIIPKVHVTQLKEFPRNIPKAPYYQYRGSMGGMIDKALGFENSWEDHDIYLKVHNLFGRTYLYHHREHDFRSSRKVYDYSGYPVLPEDEAIIETIIICNCLWQQQTLRKN